MLSAHKGIQVLLWHPAGVLSYTEQAGAFALSVMSDNKACAVLVTTFQK